MAVHMGLSGQTSSRSTSKSNCPCVDHFATCPPWWLSVTTSLTNLTRQYQKSKTQLSKPIFWVIGAYCYPAPGRYRERGIVFARFLSLFVCLYLCIFVSLFLCQQDYEKTAGPICMKFSVKVWSDHGTTWFNFGSIRMNGSPQNPQIAQNGISITKRDRCEISSP